MPKCFLLTAYPFPAGSPSYTWKACGNSSSLAPRTHPHWGQGVYWIVDGVDMFAGSLVASGTISVVPDNTPADYGNCTSCTPVSVPYDCVNGNCVESSQYNTPGIYNSLANCQAVCGVSSTDCPPGKVCLEQAEYDSINNLIAQLGGELCA